MQKAIREYDTLGRFGGEEFLVIVPETSAQDVVSLAQRVRAALSEEPIDVAQADGEIIVTASAGVAMLSDGDLTPDALLARADGALYAAKGMGRDRVVLGETPEDHDMMAQ
jgi:two-component system cell cycle response regulator